MRVGIIGSGAVAQALGEGFLKHGHEVMLGSRSPGKLDEWCRQHRGARAGDFAGVAAFGELLVLAVKGTAAMEALRAAGAGDFPEEGKTVIDTTNPLTDDPPSNGVHGYFTSLDDSLMERLQREFPKAHLVKAFNQANSSRMVNPQYSDGRPTMFICGNNQLAKVTVSGILDQFGWDVEDMGHAEAARAIEPLCMLWAIRYFLHGKWDHAFKLMRE